MTSMLVALNSLSLGIYYTVWILVCTTVLRLYDVIIITDMNKFIQVLAFIRLNVRFTFLCVIGHYRENAIAIEGEARS